MRYWAARIITLVIFLTTLAASTLLSLHGKDDAAAGVFVMALIPMLISFFFWMES